MGIVPSCRVVVVLQEIGPSSGYFKRLEQTDHMALSIIIVLSTNSCYMKTSVK